MARPVHNQADNKITLDESDIIISTLRGYQTVFSMRKLRKEIYEELSRLRGQNKKVGILIDIQNLKMGEGDANTRDEIRRLLSLDYDALAVLGSSRLGAVVSYILRKSARGRQVRYFTKEHEAKVWLEKGRRGVFSPQKPRVITQRILWVFLAALILVQGGMFAMWRQSIERNKAEATQKFNTSVQEIKDTTSFRLQAYIDALHGFRGFFKASDFVAQEDFKNYFDSLELGRNYPGLRSVAYIAAVKEENLNSFITMMRQNGVTGLDGLPFSIKSKTTEPLHFILTYISTGVAGNVGLDIGSIPDRQQLYTNALHSNDVFSSGLVEIPATAQQTAQQGFFLTIPVSSAKSHGEHIGLVNTVFNHSDFFNRLFEGRTILNDLNVKFIDSGTTIYEIKHSSADTTNSQSVTEVCATGASSCTSLVDLSVLTTNGKYLVSIPKDPQCSTTCAANGVGYRISKDASGRIIVTAPAAEQGKTITVTR